jgi:pyridoxamine 5'-phosphate oxidase
LKPSEDYARRDTSLTDPLDPDPAPLLQRWLDEAIQGRVQINPTAMSLATVDPDGHASLRMVICRGFDFERGVFTFYTDRNSPKGAALRAHPFAAAMFHWDAVGRQVRLEGPIGLAPDAESDAYFGSRPREAQIAAWSSDQSEPIESRAAIVERLERNAERFGDAEIPRPPHWGGYRLWAERVELWVGQPGRVHDRALWTRELTRNGDEWTGAEWRVVRLQP